MNGGVELVGARVRLRAWRADDRAPFAALNADPEVMRHFVAPLTREASDAWAERIEAWMAAHGWGQWALQTPELAFAGFVGLSTVPGHIPLPAALPRPVHEIGWRLARGAWGRGYASEAAWLVLAHARQVLGAPVVSYTASVNGPSQRVMQRIGLVEVARFEHPRIPEGHALRAHVLYAEAPGVVG